MKNNKIGEMLKKYRKMNCLGIADVVVELQDKYGIHVAEKNDLRMGIKSGTSDFRCIRSIV